MKIFTAEQVRRIDAYTIANEPIDSPDLMERAAKQITAWIEDTFHQSVPFIFFIGPGNNGGDGLAVARLLMDQHYLVEVYLLEIGKGLSPDADANLERLKSMPGAKVRVISGEADIPGPDPDAVIVDAIFGSGLTRVAGGLPAALIRQINRLDNLTISIDIPSGLFGEAQPDEDDRPVVQANYTLALQFPSLSFFFAENQDLTGEWEVLPIGLHPGAMESEASPFHYIEDDFASGLLRPRRKFDHKGNNGTALLVAGSYGMMGAAVLSARACLRTGIGLLTGHVPRFGYHILQHAVPESLISIDESDIIFSGVEKPGQFHAVGVGPGLGCRTNTGRALRRLIEETDRPMVVDADGLNMLAQNPEWLPLLPPSSILTPHPKEFERLAGKADNGYHRNQMQMEFAARHQLIVVLKGAHTSIAMPDGQCWFNSTGNPGMATAGSGDVLTGMILSLLGQGYPADQAALLGVFLHGLAGDLAALELTEESLMAGDIIDHIGAAFQSLKEIRDEKYN